MHEKQAGPGRFQAWMLESRMRFALVQTAISVGIVLGLVALVDGFETLRQGLGFTALVVVIAFVLNGWVWYPRAQRRLSAPSPEVNRVSP